MFDLWRKYIDDNWLMFLLIGIGLVFVAYYIYKTLRGESGTYDTEDYMQYSFLYKTPAVTAAPPLPKAEKKDSKLEAATREILERVFRRPFPNKRPDFMQNPITGCNLEIDCYNEEIKLGVEVQGRQHYEFVPFFHKTRDKFTIQKYRDEIKKRLCTDSGITLVYVPYHVQVGALEDFLMKELRAQCPHLLSEPHSRN